MKKFLLIFILFLFVGLGWPKILSAFAKNLGRQPEDECEEFSASADFAPTCLPARLAKRAEKIPLASASGASLAKTHLGTVTPEATPETLGPVWPSNPVKYAIRGAISAGVPANTIVLLLLLPVVALFIAAARHLIGLRGFGIFLPAALSVSFIATGPAFGIGLFLLIVAVSTSARIILRRAKVKLQYLPRMALILWLVSASVLGVLFLAPIIKQPELGDVSIFAVLILALLAEDFTKVQLGKSVKTAVVLTTETLILSLISFLFLTYEPLQEYALLNPETLLVSVGILDFLLGKYSGLRVMEVWRFRRLIRS